MIERPGALLIAAVLMVVIGASGLLVGLALLTVGEQPNAGGGAAAVAIPAGIGAYGAAVLVAGFGISARRPWAHRLALVTIAVGLVELAWQLTLLGADPVTLFGVAVWGFVLVLLMLPAVRSAVRPR